jgi:hypothetical protein
MEYTVYPKKKTKSHQHTQEDENKLKTNSIIGNNFYNIQCNSGPRAKDNLQCETKKT